MFSRATLSSEGDSTSIDSTLFLFNVMIKYIQNKTVSDLLSFINLLEEANYRTIGRG